MSASCDQLAPPAPAPFGRLADRHRQDQFARPARRRFPATAAPTTSYTLGRSTILVRSDSSIVTPKAHSKVDRTPTARWSSFVQRRARRFGKVSSNGLHLEELAQDLLELLLHRSGQPTHQSSSHVMCPTRDVNRDRPPGTSVESANRRGLLLAVSGERQVSGSMSTAVDVWTCRAARRVGDHRGRDRQPGPVRSVP